MPPGSFDLPIFDAVLNATMVRGSIVGTRKDLEETLMFAAMRKGAIDGRIVLEL
jgi:alcohol dehydrogenase, propanol-preferring